MIVWCFDHLCGIMATLTRSCTPLHLSDHPSGRGTNTVKRTSAFLHQPE